MKYFGTFYEAKEASRFYYFWCLYITDTGLYLFFRVLMLVSILIILFLLLLFLAEEKQDRREELYHQSQTFLKFTWTAWRPVLLDIGMKTMASRYQHLNPLLHSYFCLCLLFQNFNSLFYKTGIFPRQSDRCFLDESKKQCKLHSLLTLILPTSAQNEFHFFPIRDMWINCRCRKRIRKQVLSNSINFGLTIQLSIGLDVPIIWVQIMSFINLRRYCVCATQKYMKYIPKK